MPESVWISEAPFCQYSVALLVSMTFGSVAAPLSSPPIRPDTGSAVRAVLNGNQFSG